MATGKSKTAAYRKRSPLKSGGQKTINLALQGGGSHGAFTWGVLDRLLEEEKLFIEAITGTSAGAVNGVLLTYGLAKGGREEARNVLHEFWFKVGSAAAMSPLRPNMFEKMFGTTNLDYSPSFMAMDMMTRLLSPYQFNLFDINPLRDILAEVVDFDVVRRSDDLKLFINATNVRNGKIKVFEGSELTLDMVMASACLPFLFKTVEVDGEFYWDGGYSGNPALFPLFYKTQTSDIMIVQINPIAVDQVPTNAAEIMDRMNEISFNATLMREVRAIAFVKKLIKNKRVPQNEYRYVHMHMIEAAEILSSMGRASKLNVDWDFLQHLRDIGYQTADEWMQKHYDKINKQSTIDIADIYL